MLKSHQVIGAGVAVAGADKLLGDRAYQGMFRHLGWTQNQMRQVAAAEVLGGVLMILKPTRRLGAAIVLAASARVLAAELGAHDSKLAASRGGVLLAALGVLVAP
ncbi:hypothetical protein [Caulobacter sp. S45]|uniref:hypothetical protein n=1 Tax=Caulobacter sp. S45 TaxID=1641861 RepID=UPI001576F9C8|nr:hypothetical protein [Caulobacter sp. S45]